MGKRSKGFLGVYPCTTSKGLVPIDLLTELLYASWAVGRIESQFQLCKSHYRPYPCKSHYANHEYVVQMPQQSQKS